MSGFEQIRRSPNVRINSFCATQVLAQDLKVKTVGFRKSTFDFRNWKRRENVGKGEGDKESERPQDLRSVPLNCIEFHFKRRV